MDNTGWMIANKCLKAREEKKTLHSKYAAVIYRNPLRICTKIIIKNQLKESSVKRVESPYVVFQPLELSDAIYSHIYEATHNYNKQFLDQYDAVVFGNHMFKYLTPSPLLRILNLSTIQDCMWTFNSQGTEVPDVNLNFQTHIQSEISRFETDNSKICIIESSLHPLLSKIPKESRCEFLKNNIANIAKGYLEMATKIQYQTRYVCITTCMHCTYSPKLVQENTLITQFNEILIIGAMNLQLGVINLANLGITSISINDVLHHYYTNPYIEHPTFDFSGKLTKYGQECVKRMMYNFEQERLLLNEQARTAQFTPDQQLTFEEQRIFSDPGTDTRAANRFRPY